jgi:hypothetical protein
MGWMLRLRWVLGLLALGFAARSGGGYNASGAWEGVVMNRRSPCDSASIGFVPRRQGGALPGTHDAFQDARWIYVGEVRGRRSDRETDGHLDSSSGYTLGRCTFQGDAFSRAYAITSSPSGTLSPTLFLPRTHTRRSALLQGALEALGQRLRALGGEPHSVPLTERGVWG